MFTFRTASALLALAILTGCPSDPPTETDVDTDDTDADTDDTGLAIAGDYTDDFGGSHAITETVWTMDGVGVFNISQYDNPGMWVVAQNDSDNDFSADLWSRMDWTTDGDDLYFCQTVFDGATEDDALNPATPSDGSDLAEGCNGFPWSQLIAN